MTTKAKKRDIYVCISCGLKHKDIEAGGIYYCPNPLCTVSGNAHFRSTLESYKEVGDRHTIDPLEWLYKGLKKLLEIEDEKIRKVTKARARKLFKEIIDEI